MSLTNSMDDTNTRELASPMTFVRSNRSRVDELALSKFTKSLCNCVLFALICTMNIFRPRIAKHRGPRSVIVVLLGIQTLLF